MNIREYLTNLLNGFNEQRSALRTSLITTETQEERQAINDSLEALEAQIKTTEEQIRALPNETAPNNDNGNPNPTEQRGFDPLATYGLNPTGAPSNDPTERNDDPTSTMEYRTAFMNYFRTGQRSEVLVNRQASFNGSQDLGVLIPSTVVQDIITGVEKTHGQLYGKVKKSNLQGGVKYPIGEFSATFYRIKENGPVSERQKGGEITGYVMFGYNIGEIRLAKTLMQSILTVPVFETELSKTIIEAYVEAMDYEILKGDPTKDQCEGILTEAKKTSGGRIIKKNIIEFTDDEISDWAAWEKKLFGNIPISMEKYNPEFVMAKQTYVSNLCTMKDTTGQPIKKAGFDASDKLHKFNEYEVNRVEKDLFMDFDSCANGDFFGMLWVPDHAYAINSNLEFTVMHYFDHESNQYVDKALVINDGKVLDPKFIYLLKKKVAA